VGNWQLAVCFISESHDKAQFNWNFCSYLQDVSKTALLIKALLVSVVHECIFRLGKSLKSLGNEKKLSIDSYK
jgi:hypothetical protein